MSDTPPAWLMKAAEGGQRRLTRPHAWLTRKNGDELDLTELDEDEAAQQRSARFEQRWGIYYLPIGFLLVLWLVFVAIWGHL